MKKRYAVNETVTVVRRGAFVFKVWVYTYADGTEETLTMRVRV